jgi:hypothetical protein
VIEETLLPSIRTELEEQKQKRLCESQRLESEIEKMKEICEQKISHTAAALRFYVTATATKLREELTPLTTTKELEMDVNQKEGDLKKLIKSVEDTTAIVRDQVSKQREFLDSSCERYTVEIGQHTKSMKVLEITMTNLQSSVATDLSDMREEVRNDVSKMKVEVSDSRSTSHRACSSNEQAIQSMVSQIQPLNNFRELILERLHIEKFVNLVREWQTTTIPQVTSSCKDMEERSKKLEGKFAQDHGVLTDLTKSTSEIRRHFRMFQAIATGLDDKPHPEPSDSRLPAITPGRSGGLGYDGGSGA